MSERRAHHHPNKVLNESDFSFKILFLGGIGVGKTSIINRYVKNIFINDQVPTIGIDYRTKTVTYHSKKIKLKIFDTSGQERFHTLTKNYYYDLEKLTSSLKFVLDKIFGASKLLFMKDIR